MMALIKRELGIVLGAPATWAIRYGAPQLRRKLSGHMTNARQPRVARANALQGERVRRVYGRVLDACA
jgi:hypothetical protein